MSTARIQIPEKLMPVFAPSRGDVRWRGMHGGRGSAKSRTAAKMAAIWGAVEPLRFLCTREYQNSIKESLHEEIVAAIQSERWLAAQYDIGENYIRGIHRPTEFLFRGLRHNINSITSTSRVDVCIVEEAEDVPEKSWRKLLPTIRAPFSEVWAIWNPEREGSPIDLRLRQKPPRRAVVAEINYRDNPWFPEVLEEQRLDDLERMDGDMYAHTWEGDYLRNNQSRVLPAELIRVAEFKPGADWSGPYYGLDFGFSTDPTAGVKCWVHDGRLFIEYEAGRRKLKIADTAEFLIRRLPGVEAHVMRCDNARPESIAHLRDNGLPRAVAVQKWPGSLEDGTAHLQGYREIVIHPRCTETQQEARFYRYKVDRLSGDILREIVDAWNHYIDATRYALGPLIKRRQAHKLIRG